MYDLSVRTFCTFSFEQELNVPFFTQGDLCTFLSPCERKTEDGEDRILSVQTMTIVAYKRCDAFLSNIW